MQIASKPYTIPGLYLIVPRRMVFKPMDGCLFLLLTQETHHSLFDSLHEVTSLDHTFKHLYYFFPKLYDPEKGSWWFKTQVLNL